MTRRLALLAMVALAACDPPAQSLVPVETLDLDAYRASVHRVVEVRCGTLDCHGGPGRALRVYADTGLRLRDELRDTDVTEEELRLNVASFAAVDPDRLGSDEHLVLRKPLAIHAGGLDHVGLVHFETRDDPGWQCLARWLRGDVAPPFDALCDEAYRAKPFNPEGAGL